MRNVLLSAIILCLFSTLTAAQIPTSGNVFFGYSYYNTDISGLGHNGLNGWQGSLEGKIFHGVGIVADLGGHYGSVPVVPPISPTCVVVPCPGGSPPSGSTHIYDALFGPRFSASFGRFRPFAEFEFGVSHVATSPLGSGTSFADAIRRRPRLPPHSPHRLAHPGRLRTDPFLRRSPKQCPHLHRHRPSLLISCHRQTKAGSGWFAGSCFLWPLKLELIT